MAVQRSNFAAVAVAVTAVLLSLHFLSNGVQFAQAASDVRLHQSDLRALQDLFANWNRRTIDINVLLPGWRPLDSTVSSDSALYIDPCYYGAWRGVFCYIGRNDTSIELKWDAKVVSLVVSDASIIGTLPDTIWDFENLVSITLTGNPGLTGPIPPGRIGENLHWTLKSLDLHGNGLNGSIPETLLYTSKYIEDLDLSNNRLEGQVPKSLSLNQRLKTLNLSNNTLSGSLALNISENWVNLVTMDIAKNKFSGALPNLTSTVSLHTLNFSHNEFSGKIDLRTFIPNFQTSKSKLAVLDLSDNKFTGPMPNLTGWDSLKALNLSHNTFDAGALPLWLTNLTNLQTLALRHTNLTGELDMSIVGRLRQLTTLELDDNNISGTLNVSILQTSAGTTLQSISLKGNRIDNVIFSSGKNVFNLVPNIDLKGNPFCAESATTDTGRCLCEQRCYKTDKASNNKGIVIGSALGGSLGVAMMAIAALMYWKKRRDLLITVHEKFAQHELKPTLFSYGELQKATRDFHPDMKLGEGGFGAVYQGALADGSKVAVKQLKILPTGAAQQVMEDFLNEVVLLTSVKHRNLVKLKGCCLRGDRRLLVYELIDNYDLAETLFEHRGDQLVTWSARFNICLGVAQGLRYLHEGVDRRIIHRDIKACNVLLDHNLHPKIADFGLAMLFPNDDAHITIKQIAGTRGYMAPEYATRGQVSDKIDVFSFGVVVLEVVSGRKSLSSDTTYLVDWAWQLSEEGKLRELVDPTLAIQADDEAALQRVLGTAMACVQSAAVRRPSMAQVVGMLQGDMEVVESVRDEVDEIRVKHLALLGLNSGTGSSTLDLLLSAPPPAPTSGASEYYHNGESDHESQALHVGENSSSGSSRGIRSFEINAIRRMSNPR